MFSSASEPRLINAITILFINLNRQQIVGGTYVLPHLIIGGGDPVDKRSTRMTYQAINIEKYEQRTH